MPIQYLQYPPKFLRLPAVPAVSNLKILGVQTYRIQTTASYLQHWQYRTMTYCQYSQYEWAVSGPEILLVSTRSVSSIARRKYLRCSAQYTYVILGVYWKHWEYTRYSTCSIEPRNTRSSNVQDLRYCELLAVTAVSNNDILSVLAVCMSSIGPWNTVSQYSQCLCIARRNISDAQLNVRHIRSILGALRVYKVPGIL